MTSTTCSFVL